jgi:multidrug efflux system membrane fusion protein
MRRTALLRTGAVVALLVLGGGILGQRLFRADATNIVTTPQQRPIPVTAGVVAQQDFPIYAIGIGTVQAFNTVTVRVRVDGEIQTIAFREGQDVRAGDLLAVVDPRTYEAQLRQAEADKARDLALLGNARLDFERFSALAAREFASRQSLDTQKSLVAQLEASVQRDQAAIDNARVLLGYTTIRAPISGRVGIRLVDQGNIVHAGDSGGLVVITELNPISLIFNLPQRFLLDIADAMRRGPLTVIAYDQDNRVQLGEGRLELIDNQIDPMTGSIRLKATFANDDDRLWPGEFVNAWLKLRVSRGAVVPDSAVQSGPDGNYAFAIREDGTVEVRSLSVIASRQGLSLVGSGLVAGDRVVVDGQYRLSAGQRVADLAQSKSMAAEPVKP